MTRQPAPPVDCGHCGRRMGARRTHYVLTDLRPPVVVCIKCFGRAFHGDTYPDCPHEWHDMHDHGLSFATRAAVPWVLAHEQEDQL